MPPNVYLRSTFCTMQAIGYDWLCTRPSRAMRRLQPFQKMIVSHLAGLLLREWRIELITMTLTWFHNPMTNILPLTRTGMTILRI